MEKFRFCPEDHGKINQIGSLDEIIELCAVDKIFLPAIDFGHLNARTMGGIKTTDDYRRILEKLTEGLGFEKADNMHVHFSKIEYSKGGEVKHLPLRMKFSDRSSSLWRSLLSNTGCTPFLSVNRTIRRQRTRLK